MNTPEITTKEYRVIDAISRNSEVSQRDISHDAGLSLGLTNILINRLAKKGYLKAKKLNARKISYMITPEGLKKKTKKTYSFMKRSLKAVSSLRGNIENFAIDMYGEGIRKFVIVGSGELSDITELTLKAMHLEEVSIEKKQKFTSSKRAAVFNTTSEGVQGDNVIDIWREAEKLYGSNYEF